MRFVKMPGFTTIGEIAYSSSHFSQDKKKSVVHCTRQRQALDAKSQGAFLETIGVMPDEDSSHKGPGQKTFLPHPIVSAFSNILLL